MLWQTKTDTESVANESMKQALEGFENEVSKETDKVVDDAVQQVNSKINEKNYRRYEYHCTVPSSQFLSYDSCTYSQRTCFQVLITLSFVYYFGSLYYAERQQIQFTS